MKHLFNKRAAQTENTEPPQVRNPEGMLLMSAIVIALVGYLFWDTLRLYLAGGAGAPSFTTVVIGGLILLAGALYVVTAAIRIYIRAKKEQKAERES